ADLAADRVEQIPLAARLRRAHVDEHVAAVVAPPRLVNRGTGLAIEQLVADRRRDADDLHGLAVVLGVLAGTLGIANHLAERLVGAKEPPRQPLVDDGDARRRRRALLRFSEL